MRCATFNILHGRSTVDGEVDLGRLADAVRQLDADVLALQEVDLHQVRSSSADLTAVAAGAMGATHHRFAAALAGTPGGTWVAASGEEQPDSAAYGVALLSRYPVSRWGTVRLPALSRRVPMRFGRGPRLTWVHDEPRVAAVGEVSTPCGPLTVVSTHLSFVPHWNVHQLRRLLRVLADRPRPLLLLGDLNMDPATVRRACSLRSLVSAATFPADAPDRQLDHVLLDGTLRGAHPRGATGRAPLLPLSDHRALVVDW